MTIPGLLLTLVLLAFGFLLQTLVRAGTGAPRLPVPAHARKALRLRPRRCPFCGIRLSTDQGLIGRPLPDGRFLFSGCSVCAEQDGMDSGPGR